MMQNPDKILEILSKNTSRKDNLWKHKDLYRQLFNVDFFVLAYQNIYSNDVSMTNKFLDAMSIDKINSFIEKLKDESYQPNPLNQACKSKKNGCRSSIGVPSLDDRLIQQCIKLILESIYEPIFKPASHGFRVRKSCHTALLDIKKNSNGVIWWVEGDIREPFYNIDCELLIRLLKNKISDDRFLRLIRKFLNAGYLDDWKLNNTYSKTLQGGVLSSILSNVYFHEFDCWVEKYCRSFEDGDNKRMLYTRYSADWVVGIIGSKQDAMIFKDTVNKFFEDYLKLKLGSEKILIINGKDGFDFLGYHIKRSMVSEYQLLMPTRKEFEFITSNGYGCCVNGKWKPTALKKLFSNDDLQIIKYYNASFIGIYNYYRLADNVSNLQTARWLWKMSWGKTMANKYRSSKAKMFEKYRIGNRIGVAYITKKGQKIAYLYDQPLRKMPNLLI